MGGSKGDFARWRGGLLLLGECAIAGGVCEKEASVVVWHIIASTLPMKLLCAAFQSLFAVHSCLLSSSQLATPAYLSCPSRLFELAQARVLHSKQHNHNLFRYIASYTFLPL